MEWVSLEHGCKTAAGVHACSVASAQQESQVAHQPKSKLPVVMDPAQGSMHAAEAQTVHCQSGGQHHLAVMG